MFFTSKSHNKLNIHLFVTFFNFDMGPRSNYLVSTITLSGILGTFQNSAEVFPTSVSQMSSILTFQAPF